MKAFDGLKVLTTSFFLPFLPLSLFVPLVYVCVCVSNLLVCVFHPLTSCRHVYFHPRMPLPSPTLPPLLSPSHHHHHGQQQQLQAQHLSHGHGPPVPLTPHPSGLQPPGIPPLGGSAGLLALSSALSGQSHLAIKDDKKHHDAEHHRGERPGKPD